MPTRRTAGSRKTSKSSSRSLGNVDSNIKRTGGKFDKPEWLKIGDGNSVIVRIVDVGEDFLDGWIHPVEFKGHKGTFTRDTMCLDQNEDGTPCPGCADDLDKRYKFWTRVIQRDAEKLNAKDKVIGYEDKVVIMSGGKRLVTPINKKHKRYDLSQHDIEIEQEGTQTAVQYTVEVVDDDPEPLSRADKALIDNSKIDLTRYTTPPEFDDFYELPGSDDDDEDVGKLSQQRGSSFGARKKTKSARVRPRIEKNDNDDNDDDDDDSGIRPVRRSSSKSKKGLGKVSVSSKPSRRR